MADDILTDRLGDITYVDAPCRSGILERPDSLHVY